MRVEYLTYIDEDHHEPLLHRLRGRVFHMTKWSAMEQIRLHGRVKHDAAPLTHVTYDNSFARQKGYVCLFDLRGATEDAIERTIEDYMFLGPAFLRERNDLYEEDYLAYLIVDPNAAHLLVPNASAYGSGTHYIPQTECWYPGDMPLVCVERILCVRARRNRPQPGDEGYISPEDLEAYVAKLFVKPPSV